MTTMLRRRFAKNVFLRSMVSFVPVGGSTQTLATLDPALLTHKRCINLKKIFDPEERKRRLDAVREDINRSYFEDMKDIKPNVKKNLVPLVVTGKAIPFPQMELPDLSGQVRNLPADEEGKAFFVSFAFRDFAQKSLSPWQEAILSASHTLYEISVVDSSVMRLLKGMYLSNLRKQEREERHNYVLTKFGDLDDIRKELAMNNKYFGYVFLVDKTGHVKWKSQGAEPSEQEIGGMLRLTEELSR